MSDIRTLPSRQQRLFKHLCAVARREERAPTAQQLRAAGFVDPIKTTMDLCAGFIRSEIYGRNWRVIEITAGPNSGARTQECPWGGEPYKVIGVGGARRVNEKPISAPQGPSEEQRRTALAAATQATAKPVEPSDFFVEQPRTRQRP